MKRTISLHPYLLSLRETAWFFDSAARPIKGIKALLPHDKTYGAMRGLRDGTSVSHTTRFLSTSPPFARIADFYKACIFFPYKSCLEKQSSYSLPLSPTNLSIHVSPFL